MAVVNFRVKKISGEKSETEKKEINNVNVSSNFFILSVGKKKDDMIGDYLQVNFSFNVRYTPDIGKIDMEGYLWYTSENLDGIITEKAGKMELKPEPLKEISNAILRDSLLEATDITRKLKLPVPLNLPKVNVKPKEFKFPKAA